jgi:hypothetical protein
MKRHISAVLGLMALACGLAAAAEIDGKWTAEVKSKRGGEAMETLILKANGNKLTGSMQRRQKPEGISEGAINGNAVSFKVKRGPVTQQYKGTLTGGQLKLNVTGPHGSRDVLFTRAGS